MGHRELSDHVADGFLEFGVVPVRAERVIFARVGKAYVGGHVVALFPCFFQVRNRRIQIVKFGVDASEVVVVHRVVGILLHGIEVDRFSSLEVSTLGKGHRLIVNDTATLIIGQLFLLVIQFEDAKKYSWAACE